MHKNKKKNESEQYTLEWMIVIKKLWPCCKQTEISRSINSLESKADTHVCRNSVYNNGGFENHSDMITQL